jgi:hypothetical protein
MFHTRQALPIGESQQRLDVHAKLLFELEAAATEAADVTIAMAATLVAAAVAVAAAAAVAAWAPAAAAVKGPCGALGRGSSVPVGG